MNAEVDGIGSYPYFATASIPTLIAYRHNGSTNVLYFDGHVGVKMKVVANDVWPIH